MEGGLGLHELPPAWGDGGDVEELVGEGEVAGEVLEEGFVGEDGSGGRGGGRQGGR